MLCAVEMVRNVGDSYSSIKCCLCETPFTTEGGDIVWEKCKTHLMYSEYFPDKLKKVACHNGVFVVASILVSNTNLALMV
jgi:hypothetical protein